MSQKLSQQRPFHQTGWRMPPQLSQLLLLLAGFARLVDAQGDCMPQGSVAIFMVYQAENPDSVFFSEDGCLAGGGRGTGCCAGAQCRVCEPNQVTSAGVSSCAGTRASANPARRETCSSGWARTRASSAPPGGTSPWRGRPTAYSARRGRSTRREGGPRRAASARPGPTPSHRSSRIARPRPSCTARRMGQSLTTRWEPRRAPSARRERTNPRREVATPTRAYHAPRGRTRTAERRNAARAPRERISRTRAWPERSVPAVPGGQVLRQRRQRGLLPVLPDRQPRVRRVHEARAGILRDPVVVLQRRRDGAGAHGQVLGFPQGALPQRLHQVRRRQLVRHRDVFHHRVTKAVSLQSSP